MLALTPSLTLYALATGCFVTALIVANLMGALIVQVTWPIAVTVSAGIFAFPITFLLTDLVNEYYGVKGARTLTVIGFLLSILTFVLFKIGELATPATQVVMAQSDFMKVSQQYTGMFVASLTAYAVGQVLDITIFQWFKGITKNRYIWLRATGSTLLSQLVDSFLVGFIGLWGQLAPAEILAIATANYWIKFAVALGITPLLYAGHWAFQRLLAKELTLQKS
jgi:queuosine precursor transporter